MGDEALPWSIAWQRAAAGAEGFYRSPDGRAEDHFVTAVMTDERIADSLIAIAMPAIDALARSGTRITVTDVGAADGTLLHQLMERWPIDVLDVTDWRGIDLRSRPAGLDPRVAWAESDIRELRGEVQAVPGVVVAHELLDDIPCDIVEADEDGTWRLVLVNPLSGREALGPALADTDACHALGVNGRALTQWCTTWWPRHEPTARVEVGIARDAAWTAISGLVSSGTAIAVDYSHVLEDRAAGRWDGGTLAGYLRGRPVRPIPDGGRNLSAHVALDSCAAATPAPHTRLVAPDGSDDFWWLVQSTLHLARTMGS